MVDFVSKSIIRNECGEGLMVAGDVAKRAADESGVAFGSSVDEDEASEKCSFDFVMFVVDVFTFADIIE